MSTDSPSRHLESDDLAPNQHDPTVNAFSTRVALAAALDYWEKAGCGCCVPSILDDAFDALGYDVAYWERMRHFAVELAQTAQYVIDSETSDAS